MSDREMVAARQRAELENSKTYGKDDRLCVYCGDWYQCRDHYIPVYWSGRPRTYESWEVVPCCIECNSILGGQPIFGLQERAKHLIFKYTKRLRPLNRIPEWSEAELEEMGYNMRTQIKSYLLMRDVYEHKLINLRYVARLRS
jgi:hypothetical protein